MYFLNSGFGYYLAQTVVYSLIVVIVVEGLIRSWHIQQPLLQIKFRLMVLLLPVVYLPFYLLYPARGSAHFHQQVALLDLQQWLDIRLVGGLAVWHLFAAMLALTTVRFVVKEAVPAVRHYFGHHPSYPVIAEGQFPKLDSVLANLFGMTGVPVPVMLLSAEETPVIYSSRSNLLVISTATIDLLDSEELEAVITHELAHLARQNSWTNRLLPALRLLMFYNPVALLFFHRIINDNEKLCDDIAISLTGKRMALASGLLKVFRHTAKDPSPSDDKEGRRASRGNALENRFHQELVRERVERILQPDETEHPPYHNLQLAITIGMLGALLFFVA